MSDLDMIRSLTQKSSTKIVLLVMDGLGGLPRETLGPTELEAADTPHMNRLAREGMVGLMHPVGIGISPVVDRAIWGSLVTILLNTLLGGECLKRSGLG